MMLTHPLFDVAAYVQVVVQLGFLGQIANIDVFLRPRLTFEIRCLHLP